MMRGAIGARVFRINKESRKEEWVKARIRCKVGGVREREEKKMER
jgi:hypothetical protein